MKIAEQLLTFGPIATSARMMTADAEVDFNIGKLVATFQPLWLYKFGAHISVFHLYCFPKSLHTGNLL
jgi:hypothetical protein